MAYIEFVRYRIPIKQYVMGEQGTNSTRYVRPEGFNHPTSDLSRKELTTSSCFTTLRMDFKMVWLCKCLIYPLEQCACFSWFQLSSCKLRYGTPTLCRSFFERQTRRLNCKDSICGATQEQCRNAAIEGPGFAHMGTKRAPRHYL